MVDRAKEIRRLAATDPDWCMLFYHIPKTAGTTLRSLWTSNKLPTFTYGYDFWKSQTVVDRRFLSTVRHATTFGNSFKVRQLRHHLEPSLRAFWALYHPTHAVHCALLGCHADWMLIGACDPML